MLTPNEFALWIDQRKKRRAANQAADTLSVLSKVGTGLAFVPVVGQLVGIPLAAAAGAAATSAEAGFASSGVIQGGVVYGQGAGLQALTQGAQVAQNVGTPGAREALTAGKASVPGQTAKQRRGYAIEAGQIVGETAASAVAGGVGGVAGAAIGAAGKSASLGAGYALRGDYSKEATLELGVGIGAQAASVGGTALGGVTGEAVKKIAGAAPTVVAQTQPLRKAR